MGQISSHKQTCTWNEDDHPVSFQQYLDGKLTMGTHRTYDGNGRLATLTSSNGDTVPTVTHYVREGLKETVTTTREGEGTLSTSLYFYDEQDNVLSAYDLQSKCILISATNYIGTDGTRSTGIPADIYTEGRVIFPHPSAYILKNEQPAYNLPDWAQSDDFIPNPPRRDTGKTEYLQTACCNPSPEGDRLLLRQYDKNFRVIEESEYQGGREIFHSQYTYQGNDHVLITTETTSNLTTGENGHHVSRSGDGYTIAPGRTVEVTFYERMDDNGNVLEQITCTGGRITCAKTFTYDESGNLLESTKGTLDYASRTTCAYDTQGHLIQKASASNFETPDRDSVSEYRWIYDENGYLIQTDYYRNGRLLWSDLYTNDAQGNMLSCEQRSDPNQSRITTYHRDERQHLTVEDTVQVNGTSARREISQYDDHDNLLRTISGQDGSITWAANYLGTDGSRIIGIPRETWDEGYAEVSMPTLNLPPLPYDEDERKDLCLRNWTIFLSNLDYQVNILQTSDVRSPLPAQLKSRFEDRETQVIFFMQDRLILTGDQGFMRRNNIDYERSAGSSWYPLVSQTEPEAYRWYEPLLLHRDNLSFLSDETVDGVREVTYRIAPRPGEDRPSGAITYKLLEGGDMAGVRLTEDVTACDGYQVDVRRTTEVTVQSASYDALDWAFIKQERYIADVPPR